MRSTLASGERSLCTETGNHSRTPGVGWVKREGMIKEWKRIVGKVEREDEEKKQGWVYNQRMLNDRTYRWILCTLLPYLIPCFLIPQSLKGTKSRPH